MALVPYSTLLGYGYCMGEVCRLACNRILNSKLFLGLLMPPLSVSETQVNKQLLLIAPNLQRCEPSLLLILAICLSSTVQYE